MIRSELQRVAASAELKAFELPRDIVIETEPFSQENGLLTGIRKRMRGALQRKYGPQLEQLYVDLERRQQEELLLLRNGSSHLTVYEKICKALVASLGMVEAEPRSSFAELGGDSLAAAAFAGLLEDIFGVKVSVNAILSPAGNATRWARLVETTLSDARTAPTFASAHGSGAGQLHAKNLNLGAFLDTRGFEQATTRDPISAPSTVLLTGATGFLGRFLCVEWLERLAPEGGKLICLVRAPELKCRTTSTRLVFRGRQAARTSVQRASARRFGGSRGRRRRGFARCR